MQTRTDERGAFRFTGVAPGTYRLTTPVTDFIAPDVVEVSASNAPLEARLAMDETAVNIRVCRDCRDSWFKLPALAIGVPGDGPSASALARAEPAEGWDAFNQRPLSYPAGLKTLKVEGTVALEGVIRPDGTTGDLQVASSPSAQLTAAAVALVQSQRWRPARVRTTPVQVPLHATVEFTLNGN
jgi:TonB family protein